jgi:hypothetical protein
MESDMRRRPVAKTTLRRLHTSGYGSAVERDDRAGAGEEAGEEVAAPAPDTELAGGVEFAESLATSDACRPRASSASTRDSVASNRSSSRRAAMLRTDW